MGTRSVYGFGLGFMLGLELLKNYMYRGRTKTRKGLYFAWPFCCSWAECCSNNGIPTTSHRSFYTQPAIISKQRGLEYLATSWL